eukprot:TCONS_00072678-protein
MVFESLVADLLNKYLGQYVKNLDASQLKIGIWGGNVVLTELELKDTALDDLDLPIKVVRGYLGKLVLSIPWKNLYTESTVVDIQDLHLVAKPNFDIKYNEEREEKSKHDKKQQQIHNIEEARQREEDKKKGAKKEESDGFAEKLATNVIKNLQVTIKNIHVRYEDSISDVNGPFSVGLTMESLTAQTTDEDFVPKIIKESVSLIHKMVKLDNLALYWNPGDELIDPSLDTKQWLEVSTKQISTHQSKPEKTKYILSPMVATKKLKLNTKPGSNLDIPKMFLNLVLEELGIIVARSQYHGVVQLIESFERMNRNQPFRKYRPHTSVLGNESIWWKYCMSSILEVDVKRRSQMWSWKHIQKHRVLCKAYKVKYKEKLKQKNPSKQILTELESMEDELNIASITIFRQLAATEVLTEQKKKGTKGSFFSFFSRSKEPEKSAANKIGDLMGDDQEKEMQKLYDAIGYTENEVITPFPKEYVAMSVESILQKLFISLIDDTDKAKEFKVLDFSLNNIIVEVFQRPSAQALKLCAKIGEMKLFGTASAQCTPLIIKNMLQGRGMEFLPLVDFIFETNPLKKPDIDQCITAICQPLEIIYDANTINHIISFFKPPEHVILQDLQDKAYSTFEDFKVSSTAGLLHAMEQRTVMDIDIDVGASHLIIPEKGSYNGCTDMLVIDFGKITMSSDPSQIRHLDPKDIEDVNEVQSKAYDRFLLSLQALQILLVREGEDLKSAKSNVSKASSHILHPINFDGKLAKAILPQDPRLKQICVSGELSSLFVSVSDDKVSRLIKLADSIPLPQSPSHDNIDGEEKPEGLFTKALSMISLTGDNDTGVDIGGFSIPVPTSPTSVTSDEDEYGTPPDGSILQLQQEAGPDFSSGVANQVKVDLNFKIHKVMIAIGLTDKALKQEKECLKFIVDDINTEVILRRWDLFVNAEVGRLVLNEMTWGVDGEPFAIMSTPKNTKMLKFSYRRCEFNESLNLGPSYFYSKEAQVRALHFKDEFGATDQILDVQVATLFLMLHQEALLSIMSLIYQVLEPLNKHDKEATQKIKRSLSTAGSRLSLSIEEKEKERQIQRKLANPKALEAANELKQQVGLEEEKKMRVTAHLDGVGIMICSAKVDLAQAFVKGLSAKVLMKDDLLEVKASMKDMQVQDNVGETKYKDIISMRSDEVFDLELAIYENGSSGSKQYDMSCVDTSVKLNFGQMRVVFLYRFIQDLMSFTENFEEAQKAVVEAGKAAKDKALETATDLNRHSSRVKLNVVLKAPTIIIPVGSNNELALLVDLGELRIYNTFKLLNDDQYHKKSIITDNMTIKLSNLKLLKALIQDGKDFLHQRAIIEPMMLQITIVRNLTKGNHSIPDVSVQAKMPAILLSISEEDVTVALKIVQGNLAEGESHAPKKQAKPAKQTLNVPQDRLADIYEEPEDEDENRQGYLQTKLSFDLAKIDIKLYLKPSDMTFEDEFLARTDDLLLALFTIGNLCVDGDIMSTQAMKMSVRLDTLVLDDMRPIEEHEGVKRMINYSPEPLLEEVKTSSHKRPIDNSRMIEIQFDQTSSQDKNIDIKLCNMLCIFNVEFIMVLLKTLQAAIPKDDSLQHGHSMSSLDSAAGSGGSDDEDSLEASEIVLCTGDQERPETKVSIFVHNPQIVLLADAKDVKTNALFLTTEINFQYFELRDTQKMIGAVSNTAILSTAFKNDHRSDISTVLSLDSINLHSSSPINGKPHMSVSTTLIKLNISPKTIRTLSACAGYISNDPTDEEIKEARKAMRDLWQIQTFTNKRPWYLNHPPQQVLSAGSFVLARTRTGEYKHGFLAKKDVSYQVYFSEERGTASHRAMDISSVVLDIVPLIGDLCVGCNVLAVESKEHGYRTGRITQVWDSNVDKDSSDGAKQSVSVKTTAIAPIKYLVNFYDNQTENFFPPDELRIIGKPIKGVVPGLGACVYARFNDGFYYRGKVDDIEDYRIRVQLDEISGEIEHDIDDPSAVILNLTPQYRQVKKHFKVIASKGSTTKGYHPGKVTAIQGEGNNRLYSIRFEDGTINQVPITKLILMPKAPFDALPEVGTYVYSRVSRDAPLYEKGIVAEKNTMICVKHLNGRKLAHEIQNIHFVVRNIVPLVSSLKVGLDVIVQPDNDDQKMYLAVIREVTKKEGDKTNRYLVEFTDGSKKRVTPSRIRILSQYGSAETSEENADIITTRQEELVLDVQGISLRVEGYLGGVLTPMLKMDSKITANLKDWSSQMNAHATVSLEASYYNENVAEWEPVIEPLMEKRRERPWQLSVNYTMEGDDNSASSTSNELVLQKPESNLKIKSQDNLELTISKSCLALLGELGQVFGDAVESVDVLPQVLVEKEPFMIENLLSKKVTVTLNELLQGPNGDSTIELASSSNPVGITFAPKKFEKRKTNDLYTINLSVDGFHDIKDIVVQRKRSVIYDLVPIKLLSAQSSYSIVVQVKTTDGQRIIVLRSPLQLKNHFPMPLDVSYISKENQPVKLTTVGSGDIYSFPLLLTYHSVFHLKPAGFDYGDCTEALNWSDLKTSNEKQFSCPSPDKSADPFYMQVVMKEETYSSVHGMLDCVPRYTLECFPVITLHNYLPCTINYKIKGMAKSESLPGGHNWPLFTVNFSDKPSIYIEIESYNNQRWEGGLTLPTKPVDSLNKPSLSFVMMSGERKMELGVYYQLDGSLNITLYSPYWLLNKTGKPLVYQPAGSSIQQVHQENDVNALMMLVKGKHKKAKVKVKNSESWSNEFSLDTVGSGGSLKCNGPRDRVYEIGLNISLSYFGLTKIVTFTPLRMLSNHTKYTISMAESNSKSSEWHTVNPDENIPFWPTKLPLVNLYININGQDSVKFNPEVGKTLLLKFQNEVGGVCVDYQEKDSSSVLSFNPYFAGAAPVRLENLCKKIGMIAYKQAGSVMGHVLTHDQSVLYTWDDPTMEQELICSIVNDEASETRIKLDANDFGRMRVGDGAIYWVSFLDGLQRVLLFTDNFKSAYCACQEQNLRPTMEVDFEIESFGLSLVNVDKRMEIGYLAIRQSKTVWEQRKKKNRWKALPLAMCEALEEGYLNYQNRKGAVKEKVLDKEVDYEKMFITKPEKIKIRRTYHSGLGFKYTISPNEMRVHASISSIQLDSHVPGSTFPTVLHMVEPPKSVASENAPKPFFELSLMTRIGDKNVVNEVSYCHVLIQEMDVRVDIGFLLALMELFSHARARTTEKEQYALDIGQAATKFEESAEFQAAKQDRYYVLNDFHLSPLKIHVSFSLTGGSKDENAIASLHGNVLNLLLQSVGLAFTEIQDVQFKLACYEVHKSMQSNSQLGDGITKHYQTQAIKQLYVLVLGLDVLGNPYGLISGVGTGAKNFFYEPYQGLIQGPEEFAEGLAYGVKSLVGGTVGGVSGAVSKITGTFGKGLAALTLDEEYQQKRRENMSQRPTNLGEGLAKGGKGLVKGIVSGVTGIVTKPYEGAKNDGAGGFFKGVGKGLIGVVARPVGGVVDMASNTFDGLKSTTSGVKAIELSRVTRVFHADKVLRPFNLYEADGNKILMQCNKGEYAKKNFYITHVVDKKNYLILTQSNILYVGKNELKMGEWESVWVIEFNELKREPEVKETKIIFHIHNTDTRRSIFKKSTNTREVILESSAVADWFILKLRDAKML